MIRYLRIPFYSYFIKFKFDRIILDIKVHPIFILFNSLINQKLSGDLNHVPIFIIPFSSRLDNAFSLKLGMFFVISSAPSLVCLASISNFSI